MRKGLQLAIVLVGVLVLGSVGFNFAVPQDAAASSSPPPVPRMPGSTPKVHVIEVLTGTWCPPCGIADPALSRIADEWSDNMLVLAYHCCQNTNPLGGGYDPWYDPSVLTTRNTFYGFQFLPTTVMDGGGRYTDGTLFKIGAANPPPPPAPPASASYDMFRFPLEDSLDATSNVALSLSGDLRPANAQVTVTITATDPLPETNLYLRTVLYEDGLYRAQANGIPYHRNVARTLNEQPFLLTYPGSVTLSASFVLNPAWNPTKLGVLAFVQSGNRNSLNIPSYPGHFGSDILNAAYQHFTPRGILVHRDRGTTAEYSELYEQVLANRNEAFETYNIHALGTDTGAIDDRGLPSGTRLADAPLLIWHTGPTDLSVLSLEDRTLLGSYLDGGGSVLVTGSDIGFDAWTNYQAWYKQYFHAAFEGDDTGRTTVTGVAGDPISDPFASTSLGILGDPDRINTVVGQTGSAVPFGYTSTLPASIRAQHDADSRVVYLGFQYFENTIDAYRGWVMANILNWTDGAAPPKVDVLYPDGGEQVDQGAPVDIRWHATDVRVPADAVDVYFNADYPGGTWQLVAAGEPNDGLFRWTLPNVDSLACRIKVVVRDSSPESGDGEAVSSSNFTCGAPGFQITFTSTDLGWHLISFPTILADTSAPAVLSSMAGNYGIVRWYDAADASDPWKAYAPAKGGGDLVYLDNTMGFWIEVTGPGTFIVMGSKPVTPQFVPLRTGWNLVSFPSYKTDYTVAQLKADTGATKAEAFDSTAGPYYLRALGDTDILRAGDGYWVYVPSDVVWTVPV